MRTKGRRRFMGTLAGASAAAATVPLAEAQAPPKSPSRKGTVPWARRCGPSTTGRPRHHPGRDRPRRGLRDGRDPGDAGPSSGPSSSTKGSTCPSCSGRGRNGERRGGRLPHRRRAGRGLCTGRLSPVDAVEAHLARIAALDGKVGSYITLTADRAREQARAAAARYQKGAPLSNLDGVPFAPKDIFATRGIRTTHGSKLGARPCTRRDRHRGGPPRGGGRRAAGQAQPPRVRHRQRNRIGLRPRPQSLEPRAAIPADRRAAAAPRWRRASPP